MAGVRMVSMAASPQSQQYRFAVDVYAHLRPKNVQSSVPPGQTVYSKKGRPPRARDKAITAYDVIIGSSKNPPTPLDSLVDVALNMTEDSPPSRRRRRARRRRDGAHLARGCVVRWTCVRTKLRRMGKNQRSKLEGVNHEHDWGRLLHRRLSLLRRGCLREVRKKKRVRFLNDRVLLHHHQTLMWMRMGTLILILIRNLVRHRRAFLV
ncbi:hypothetical protein ARMGADRAFT_567304 [Armillaria gallica]|uniref:Uncharacterized protein n=1 Tax=Armillaria gallica TaxID=47427 RepID=A0A2H3DS84_ARMGA|nr:hypothetical protein ARMGADRAFT_567304 [Armillaria gallica]